MLRHRNGLLRHRNPSTLLENIGALLLPSSIQFRFLSTTIVRIGPLSSTSRTKVHLPLPYLLQELADICYECRFDKDTNLLHPSRAQFMHPPSHLAAIILKIFHSLGLVELVVHPTTGVILETSNLTILNFFLVRLGPMGEKRLCQVLMCSQVMFSSVRWAWAGN
jgi:hypothetical protein